MADLPPPPLPFKAPPAHPPFKAPPPHVIAALHAAPPPAKAPPAGVPALLDPVPPATHYTAAPPSWPGYALYQHVETLVGPIEEIAVWWEGDWPLELIELAMERRDALMVDGVWWYVVPVSWCWYGNPAAFAWGKRPPAA